MNKFFIIKLDDVKLKISIHPEAPMLKNPMPILWNYKGSYYWIPVEIVKNEISDYLMKEINCKIDDRAIEFSLQQAYLLRTDIGKILEELGNENNSH